MYTENLDTGDMTLYVQRYPLARYEYFLNGAMHRRIDIRQQVRIDTTFTESLIDGTMIPAIQKVTEDIPNGAYHEFFPNGNIRIKGTLDGYNPDGSLKKTGEWREWDSTGKVIHQRIYP